MFSATVYTVPTGEQKYKVIVKTSTFEVSFSIDFFDNTAKIVVKIIPINPKVDTSQYEKGWVTYPPELLERELFEMLSDLFLIDYVERQGDNYLVFYGQLLDPEYFQPVEALGAKLYDLLADYSFMRREDALRN